ncbi:molybdate ABC transporter substrate-binding protein [Hymenobacter aerilatus]|uniref:Molybdate ABC transporter substrate-binding protein n=1 Tax=Hymenobacter aerilatus TaxID=2932251 RepID=A0A8T9SXL5_9BACT|nr:molybdate ABC transporter substrate-binding protein [Hymenobacter aerilatus]UOR06467.1 molybdate ABC transporter substrate-binding protein [Hymenobacter aerilatus]
MPRFRFLLSIVLLLLGSAGAMPPSPVAPPPLTIAAASDLQYVMDSLLTIYRRQHPQQQVKVVYGSSGKFYQQLSHGAPFDIYFSADSNYPQKLHQEGLTARAPQRYATGRLVVWSKKFDPRTQGMNTLLNPAIRKIAVANPAHAPYGQKAQEALQHYNLYNQLKPRLVLGENISQTAQYATTGAAEAGLLALSLARSPQLRRQGHYYLIPANAHTPLEQAFVVMKRAAGNSAAASFTAFISSAPAKAALKRYGFE